MATAKEEDPEKILEHCVCCNGSGKVGRYKAATCPHCKGERNVSAAANDSFIRARRLGRI